MGLDDRAILTERLQRMIIWLEQGENLKKDCDMLCLANTFKTLGMSFEVTVGEKMNEINFGGCDTYDTGFVNGQYIVAFFNKDGEFLHMVMR